MNKKNDIGGTIKLKLDELLDDEIEQIVMSNTLFNAFDNSSKLKKHYNRHKSKILFRHVVYLYNDSFDESKFRSIIISGKNCKQFRLLRAF